MASTTATLRPLACWKAILRRTRQQKALTRSLTTFQTPKPLREPMADMLPKHQVPRKLKVIAPPPSAAARYREPIKALTDDQIKILDPSGRRTHLFSKTNRDAAKVGDILLVRLKNGDPFAGVCINIRRRGVDTGILLRNQLMRVGVEMWYKIYSPNVEGIEVVQRKHKRARRARLTYMRKPKHDMGSVKNIVLQYQREKIGFRNSGEGNTGGQKKGKGRK